MLRKVSVVAMAVVMLAMLGQSAYAAKVFRVGMGDTIDSDQGAMMQQFKSLVESLSDGKYEVQLFPGGALGTETEMLQNTRRGTLDMAVVGVGNAVPFVKPLGTLTMPYLIESHYDAIKATTGGLGAHWNELSIKQGGFRILGWTYSNFRYITNSKRPVEKLADIEGLKIRIPQNKIILATLKSWGANPVPMAWSETFTALQQGVVDGQENPYIVDYTMKFHEVQDYITEVHYQYSLQPLIIGQKMWESFDQETRDLLTRAGIEAQQYCIAFQILEAEKAKQGLIANGMQVSTLEDEDKWRQLAVEKVWPEYYDFIGGKENIDMVLEALGKK